MRGIKVVEVALAVGVVFLLLVLALYVSTQTYGEKEAARNVSAVVIVPAAITPLENFLKTLEKSEELAIVKNISGLDEVKAHVVYQCGIDLAGSWGLAGKNISKLYIYVIDGQNCIFGSPLLNETIEKSTDECVVEFESLPRFYITYGASFSTFTNTTASIYIDESWRKRCSFVVE